LLIIEELILFINIVYIIILTQALRIFLFSTQSLVAREKTYKEATIESTSSNATNYTINEKFLKDSKKQKN